MLYGVDPDDFVATRDELSRRARDSGDRVAATAIHRLRRPSTAAWAVNLLAREAPELAARLADLGRRLRVAQTELDAARIQSLRPERDRLLADVLTETAELAGSRGRPLSQAARDEVRDCVIAAIASADATAAVTSGRLTRALSYSGLGEVDLSDAVARGGAPARLRAVPDAPGPDPAEDADAAGDAEEDRAGDGDDVPGRTVGGGDEGHEEDGRDAAAAHLAAATRAHDRAETEAAEAAERVERARERAARAADEVGRLESALSAARAEDRAARGEVTEATRGRRSRERALVRARTELEEARRPGRPG